jgi:hypothetical protein
LSRELRANCCTHLGVRPSVPSHLRWSSPRRPGLRGQKSAASSYTGEEGRCRLWEPEGIGEAGALWALSQPPPKLTWLVVPLAAAISDVHKALETAPGASVASPTPSPASRDLFLSCTGVRKVASGLIGRWIGSREGGRQVMIPRICKDRHQAPSDRGFTTET